MRDIAGSLSPDGPGEQSRLEVRDQAEGYLSPGDRMFHFPAFRLLVRFQDSLSQVVLHDHRPAFPGPELFGFHSPQVDQAEDRAIDNHRPELLHQVERQRRTAWTKSVEESHLRIEADSFQRRATVMGEDRVKKGKERIYRVTRRSTVTLGESPGIAFTTDHVGESGEICCRGCPFDSPQFIKIT